MNPHMNPPMYPSDPVRPTDPVERSRSDLKAQEDLLALKVLSQPDFLLRVPTLPPASSARSTQAQTHAHANAHANAQAPDSMDPEDWMHALSQEVHARVMRELEMILPNLISSCMTDVLEQSELDRKAKG